MNRRGSMLHKESNSQLHALHSKSSAHRMSTTRRLTRTKIRRSTRFNQSVCFKRTSKLLNYISSIPGVVGVPLAPLTQKFVECSIGSKVTLPSPWIYVDKEKVETHIEFYQEDSEFYPFRQRIETFPKNEILVGSFCIDMQKPAMFYICLSLMAEEIVLNFLDAQRQRIVERVKKMQTKLPGERWQSYGSEKIIDAEASMNLRNLYIIEISEITLVCKSTKFKFRMAEDVPNGYIEMLPGREVFNTIYRCRMDKAIQSAPVLNTVSVQTNIGGLYTKCIQYEYICPEIQISALLDLKIRNFLKQIYRSLCNTMKDNIHMSLRADDYQKLAANYQRRIMKPPFDYKTYQEIFQCAEKKVSCFSWHALRSGIVAAAYVKYPFFLIQDEPFIDIIKDPAEEKNFVLIWNYNNNVKPMLCLSGKTEITAISFCPYNTNILVAGYNNGQVAIWDLKEQFAFRQSTEYLSPEQQATRVFIEKLTMWIKRYSGDQCYFPTITSALEESHKSPVTSISWYPPEKFHINEPKLRFVTSELDGNSILVWEVNECDEIPVPHTKRRFDRPAALDRGKSKYQKNNHFLPICRINLHSLEIDGPMMKLFLQNEFLSYKATNPSTLRDLNKETNFEITGFYYPHVDIEKVLFTTLSGVLQLATCRGLRDPKDPNIHHREICEVQRFKVVHDGPILGCETNIFFPNLVLTVGGYIFAIWNITRLKDTVLWRKSTWRYLSGIWCLQRPLTLLLMRSDRLFEYWDITESSKIPLQVFKYHGYDPINFYGTTHRFYIRKNTFIVTDSLGGFKVFVLASETLHQDEMNIYLTEEFLEHTVSIKRLSLQLSQKHKKLYEDLQKYLTNEVEDKTPDEKPDDSQIKIVPPTKAEIFEAKRARHALAVLLELRGLNLHKIETELLPFRKTCDPGEIIKTHFGPKRDKTLEEIQFIKDHLLRTFRQYHFRHREIKTSITNAQAREIRRLCFESYKEVERRAIKEIKQRREYIFYNERTVRQSGISDFRKVQRPSGIRRSQINYAFRGFQQITADLPIMATTSHRPSAEISRDDSNMLTSFIIEKAVNSTNVK